MTNRSRKHQAAEELFDGFHRRFGELAPLIIQFMVESAGGLQIRIPDLQDLWRKERNRRIRNEFTGFNYEELAIKYGIKARQVRRIVQRG